MKAKKFLCLLLTLCMVISLMPGMSLTASAVSSVAELDPAWVFSTADNATFTNVINLPFTVGSDNAICAGDILKAGLKYETSGEKEVPILDGTPMKSGDVLQQDVQVVSCLYGGNLYLTSEIDYSVYDTNYLTLTALEDSTVTINWRVGNVYKMQYSLNGSAWADLTRGQTLTMDKDDVVRLRGGDCAFVDENHFEMTGKIAASGSVTSLIDKKGTAKDTYNSSNFNYMFKNCAALVSAPELPATTLTGSCYVSMFEGCTGLTEVPELPATTLVNKCYNQMFKGCTGLTTIPNLPAAEVAMLCYSEMFKDCTGLTLNTDPSTGAEWKLTATNESDIKAYWNCFRDMFAGCTNVDLDGNGLQTPVLNTSYYQPKSTTTGMTEDQVIAAVDAIGVENFYNKGLDETIADFENVESFAEMVDWYKSEH